MGTETVIDVILLLAKAPRTAEQTARHLGIEKNHAQAVLKRLHDRGIIYVADEVPPIVGPAAAIYDVQPGLAPHARPDCPRWSTLSPKERYERRLDYYGEAVLEQAAATRSAKAKQTKEKS